MPLESIKSQATNAAIDAVSKRLAEKKSIWVGIRMPICKCQHQPHLFLSKRSAEAGMQAMHAVYFMVVQELAMSIYLSSVGMLLLQDDASDYDGDECQPTGRLKAYAGNAEAAHEEQMHRLLITDSFFPGPCRPCWTIRCQQQHLHLVA